MNKTKTFFRDLCKLFGVTFETITYFYILNLNYWDFYPEYFKNDPDYADYFKESASKSKKFDIPIDLFFPELKEENIDKISIEGILTGYEDSFNREIYLGEPIQASIQLPLEPSICPPDLNIVDWEIIDMHDNRSVVGLNLISNRPITEDEEMKFMHEYLEHFTEYLCYEFDELWFRKGYFSGGPDEGFSIGEA